MSWTITPAYKGAAVSDPDAQAYLRAVETADGQPLEPAVARAVNEFVLGCKADGIWPAIKASCILTGARTLAGALVPLVGTAPTNPSNVFVQADYNRKTGLAGDGSTKYLDSNRSNNADPQDSLHVSVYASVANGLYIGNLNNNVHLTVASAKIGIRLNSGDGVVSAADHVVGFLGGSRNNASSMTFRGNQTLSTVASVSVSRSSQNLLVLRTYDGYSTSRISFYSIGESLDLALLDTRVTTLINALAVAIP